MTLEAIEANELKALPWNEVQKLHRVLKLRQGPDGGKRADYERRILTYFTRRDELLNQEPTGVTCATCQFAKHLDGDRYYCGLTEAVTRGHWEFSTDCLEAIAKAESEATGTEAEPVLAVENSPGVNRTPSVEIATTDIAQPDSQSEALISSVPNPVFLPYFFKKPMMEYVAFIEKESVPFFCQDSLPSDRVRDYHFTYRQAHQVYDLYGGEQPPDMSLWQFKAYLGLVDGEATYAEVIKNAGKLDPVYCLEYIISVECPFIFYQIEEGKQYICYDSADNHVFASSRMETDIAAIVTTADSIISIAEKIRACISKAPNSVTQSLPPRAPWGWKFFRHESGKRALSYWAKKWGSTVRYENLPIEVITQYEFSASDIESLESLDDSGSSSGHEPLSYDDMGFQNIREYIGAYS
jgi:hypothetical protein